MRYFINILLFKIITIKYKFLGISLSSDIRISKGTKLSLGFKNGKKGTLFTDKEVELSKGVIINCYGGNVSIGRNVFIGEYVVIYGHGGVTIGENTLIAMHTCIVSANHTIPQKEITIRSQPDICLPIKIGNDVWIGANVKILGGVTIGNGCIIGAGAVVTKDLPPYSISIGVPAEVRGFRE